MGFLEEFFEILMDIFCNMPDTPVTIFDLPGLNYYCRNAIVNTLLFGEISPRIL